MEINYIAIIIASLIVFFVGMLWYSEILFGGLWIKEMGISLKDAKKEQSGMRKMLVIQFITTVATTYILAYLLVMLQITEMRPALQLAFWIWFGFLAMPGITAMLWDKRSLTLTLINQSHFLLNLIIATLVLVSM
ncbi:MAG TPA: DUF1761 domain-containing protein [Candidatus Absconditabacterales bacterium]|nr:DUF1761 domain-containing protein [Candidatus Absconditabacterales bacterium]